MVSSGTTRHRNHVDHRLSPPVSSSRNQSPDEAGVEQAEDAECDLVETSGKVPAVTTKVSNFQVPHTHASPLMIYK